MGGLQDFRTYLIMKSVRAHYTVIHSPQKIVSAVTQPSSYKDESLYSLAIALVLLGIPCQFYSPEDMAAGQGECITRLLEYYKEEESRKGILWPMAAQQPN